jgi:plastocyanin
LVTAKFVTLSKNAIVVASLTDTAQRVTFVDTCFIRVTATAPSAPLATFTLRPAAGSDTVMPVNQFYTMTATATDIGGQPVSAIPYFTSSDPSIAKIDRLTGVIISGRIGRVTLYATTWAYGVAKRDSLQFTVITASAAQVQVLAVLPTGSTKPILTFWPQIITVSAGAVVTWENKSSSDSMDVVFDDTTNVDSAQYPNVRFRFGTGRGNIGSWLNDTLGTGDVAARICTVLGGTPPGPSCVDALQLFPFARQRLRKFPVPGTYHYHSAKWGTSGTIVVQ